ncbi:FeoA domain-containing protein [Paenibacillus sp. JX-17]|uniref:FeoA domain-containing protein n=1 Tax=Paenibacillus lacisoli TaxID=3064525 RepID=A0ABT9CK32_9BACL|nr:FeoA domain-containing protein [Paenibacillus sp. JX-17]MDO7907978.1 FeoA domain-containing protein [Paenibacillus sp. JX-17]
MRLTDTSIEQAVKVMDLERVNDLVRHRLYDMGIMEGTMICLRKKLPFGGPCTIETNGQWIAIRHKEAQGIQVEAV